MKNKIKKGMLFISLITLTVELVLIGCSKSGNTNKKSFHSKERKIPVKVSKVHRGYIKNAKTYVGNVKADAEVIVYSKIPGRIKEINVDVGDRVKLEGEKTKTIVKLEGEELTQLLNQAKASLKVAQAELEKSKAEREVCDKEFERAKNMHKDKLISDSEFEKEKSKCIRAKAAEKLSKAKVLQAQAVVKERKAKLKYTEIKVPINGFVGERYLDEGRTVSTNTPILLIVNINKVIVTIQIPEKDIAYIIKNLPAICKVDAYPTKVFQGTVKKISPILDSESRTAEVQIEIENPKFKLKPGMHVIAELSYGEKENALIIPKEAVVRKSEKLGVFLVNKEKRNVKYIEIKTGVSYKNKVQLISDEIKENDWVVTMGKHLLKNNSNIYISSQE